MSTQKETIAMVARLAVLSEDEVLRVYRAMVQVTKTQLKKGDSVNFSNFKFQRVDRKAKNLKHPKTGVPIYIPARKALKFSLAGDFEKMRKGNFDV